jgi:peptidyl-prolyl cis-trans isomerase D
VQSDFGWVIVKVDSVKSEGGKSLAQAGDEIAAKLNAGKRKEAIEDLVDRVQSALDEGSNFAEAAAQARLTVTNTPPITASGASRTDAAYKLPADLAPAIKTGFEIAQSDPPEIVSLGNDKGYAVVSPAEVVSAAPAPLASIREQVARDWINAQALVRARAAASAITAKALKGVPLAEAVKGAGVPLPAVQPVGARRIQITTATGPIPAGLRTLFTLAQGKSEMVADEQGRGFAVVKVTKIVPGNALLQPGLISRMQNELQQPVSDDYARQFLAAARSQLKLERNEAAIAAMKARLASTGS